MKAEIQECQNRENWLEVRKKGLGGSDIAAIMGLNPYKGPIDVWLDKTGRESRVVDNDAVTWGVHLEEPIAEMYRERNSVKFVRLQNPLAVHPKHPFLMASPDRILYPKSLKEGLEIKTAGLRMAHKWGEEGTDQIPEEYLMQCHHYLTVLDFEAWHVAALIGGQDYREYTITRDPEISDSIVHIANEFWEHYVQEDRSPPIDASEGCKRFLDRFKKTSGAILEASDPAAVSKLENLKKIAQERRALESAYTMAQHEIMALIGDADGVKWGEGHKVLWRHQKGSVSWKKVATAKGGHLDRKLVADCTSEGSRVFRAYFKGETDGITSEE
ncbi:MAG: YqaJ viral recombinase family protein [bacterium]